MTNIETQGKMFDEEELKHRLGDTLSFSSSLDILKPVEAFLLEVLNDYPCVGSYDCSASQPFQFWTINYTSFAGFFMMNPLQDEIKHIQVKDALSSNTADKFDYTGFLSERVIEGSSNKYSHIKGTKPDTPYKALAVLSGSNLFKEVISVPKLRWVVEEHGKLAAIKPHPLTHKENLTELKNMLLPCASILKPEDDIYSIMPYVDTVYAPHSSESIINAVSLGKHVAPLTKFEKRNTCSFSHINEPLISSLEPKKLVNKLLSNYQSGLIHPEIHTDWQDRVTQYVKYIHSIRLLMKDAYK